MFEIHNHIVKLSGSLIFLAACVLFILPVFKGIANIGNMFGLFISLLGTVYFTFNSAAARLLGQAVQTKAGRPLIIIFISFLGAGIIIAAVLSILMVSAVLCKPDGSHTAILLGCKVKGSSPSYMLARRLDASYRYLTEYPDAVIIVSGGQGDNEEISEAQCMKNDLISRGIKEDRIICEDKSVNTYENISFSKKIMNDRGLGDEAVIITDSFHQYRASLIAGKCGLKTFSCTSYTPMYLIPTYWVREWFGIIQQLVLK
ncbi:MAG: YdcF family protein [Oscillospiraceae bacterium]|nr:YdcF family protein [Oscillospiraceae bacterium]